MTQDARGVERREPEEFFALVDRLRGEVNSGEVEQLGDQLGRLIFGCGSRRESEQRAD